MRIFHVGLGLGWLALAGISAGAAAAPAAKRTGSRSRPTPVVAVPSRPTTTIPKDGIGKSPPNFEAMLAFVDKLFPPQPDPDPARLMLARTAVTTMWPDGAYGKMMTGMMGGMFDRAMELKQSDLTALGGKAPKVDAGEAGKGPSIHDQVAAKDPYFDQRVAAIRAVLVDEMAKVSMIIDPRIRDGLARSMARRFDAQQLTDIDTFFATPSGHALATQYMQLWFDPDMMRSLFGSLPEMMKLMPELTQRIKAAEEKFPKPPAAHPAPPAKPEKH